MATILFNLGKLYNRKRDSDKALEMLAHSLRIQKTEASDASELAATCDQIGVAYAGKGLKSEAKNSSSRHEFVYGLWKTRYDRKMEMCWFTSLLYYL
jgi:uncharacterized protein HemY